jgi:transcriptional regulator with XRE-family HTH domain
MIGIVKAKLLAKLKSKKYRDAYVAAEVTTGIAYQIRALREQRGWTQWDLGNQLKKGQNAVSRLEDPDYGRLTVKTLTELASAYDVGLLVKFVPFSKFLTETATTPSQLEAIGFEKELTVLERIMIENADILTASVTTSAVNHQPAKLALVAGSAIRKTPIINVTGNNNVLQPLLPAANY